MGNGVGSGYCQVDVQGAGMVAQPIVVTGGTLGPTSAGAPFTSGYVDRDLAAQRGPDTVVDLQGGAAIGTITAPCS